MRAYYNPDDSRSGRRYTRKEIKGIREKRVAGATTKYKPPIMIDNATAIRGRLRNILKNNKNIQLPAGVVERIQTLDQLQMIVEICRELVKSDKNSQAKKKINFLELLEKTRDVSELTDFSDDLKEYLEDLVSEATNVQERTEDFEER